MAIRDIIEHLSYNGCDCSVYVKENVGVKGVCPKHPKSVLTVHGARVGVVLKELEKKKLDRKGSGNI